ncbi:winged helix-turn-helix domain-containing protein [Streptomyces pseudovenezuelae]|uniref:DNA-binding transcriptional ArsR family regulator n=1 Tax=Streptomyces pseudovenezuelae TaxID=67350 RepID=A0ABT6M1W2_9ACTN|nr:winged helix-turn-helix domain-containing protein [Streptomyces pseudovenezuelae]MDH6222085.1 DNA-binding transcriptional ArsR family regulator [Streptomyces pseudovenezuelae]
MLRIHFTSDDLQRIRLARQPEPMWEVVCSLCRLQSREGEAFFGKWRQHSVTQLSRPDFDFLRAVLRPLVPLGPYIPDFLTPAEPEIDPEGAIDTVLRTSPQRLRHDLTMLSGVRALPSWTVELADGRRAPLNRLGRALHGYFDATLAPVWQDLREQVDADVHLRVRQLVDGGSEALLRELPTARWEPPVLFFPYPADRDLHLAGRGLRLVPSFFCWRRVLTLVDQELTPTLVYPVQRQAVGVLAAPADDPGGPTLSALLGRTRASILESLADAVGKSTSELAWSVGVSLPTSSQQVSVLRAAGLIASQRDGKRVLHSATRLGRALVESGGHRHQDTISLLARPGRL